ncbi:hypothetical protein BVI434_2310001 [Burkholderia vietnamiensis]|nr:hypothetical protein BVI434_2310001 [Burkholderia vietnamiensis]
MRIIYRNSERRSPTHKRRMES